MNFLQVIQEPVNLGLTVLVVLMAAYWLLVIFGLADLELLDPGDVDLPGGGGGMGGGEVVDVLDGGSGGGAHLRLVLGRLLNLGEVPASVVLSVVLIVVWTLSLLLTLRLGLSGWEVAAAAVPAAVVGGAVAKVVTLPVRALYRSAEGDDRDWRRAILGRPCTVATTRLDEGFGRAEVATGGAPLVIEARVRAGRPALGRGDTAVVFGREPGGVYLVERIAPEEARDPAAVRERALRAARADRALRAYAAEVEGGADAAPGQGAGGDGVREREQEAAA